MKTKVFLPRVTEETIVEVSDTGMGWSPAEHVRAFLVEQPEMARFIISAEQTIEGAEGLLIATAITLYECLKAQMEKGE